MSHMSAILRNAFTAVKRRELEAQIYAPMPVLSELYFPASSTALPTYNTGYNKRPLRHSQLKGGHSDMPVLSVVFCTSAQMGLPDYSPDGKNSDALNVFLKASRQASDLSFAMVEKLKMQGALARVAYKSEETEAGRIWQLGVSMPVTRPFWNRSPTRIMISWLYLTAIYSIITSLPKNRLSPFFQRACAILLSNYKRSWRII